MSEWIKYHQSLNSHHKILAMATWIAKQPRFIAWIMDGCVTNDAEGDASCSAYSGATRCAYSCAPRKATIAVVVSSVLEFWCRSNGHGRIDGNDLILSDACVTDCDDIGGAPLIGEALQRVGFIIEENVGSDRTQLRLPNYLEHNVPASDRSGKHQFLSGS